MGNTYKAADQNHPKSLSVICIGLEPLLPLRWRGSLACFDVLLGKGFLSWIQHFRASAVARPLFLDLWLMVLGITL